MNENNQFDCVVLGENLAGLWGAKRMLDQGLQVLIVATGTSSAQNVIPKFVAEEFGLPLKQVSEDETNPLQILTQNRRFRVYHDQERFKQEYEFQFGKAISATSGVDPSILRGLSYWVRGGETGAVLSDEWPSLSSRILDTLYFDQPSGWLTQVLLATLELQGATVVKPGNLRRIFTDKKTFVGIQLANTSQMLSVHKALANTQLDYLNSFFNEPLPVHSQAVGWKFEMTFECTRDFLPVGLSDRMIYVEEKAPILEIFQEKPGKFRLKTMLPLQEYTLDRGEQRRLAGRMLKVCEGLLPDLEYNLRRVSPDLRDPERAMNVDLPALYPFQEMKRIPPHLLCYGGQSPGLPLSPVSGLWITNEEANPKENIWGGFDAARSALKSFETPASSI